MDRRGFLLLLGAAALWGGCDSLDRPERQLPQIVAGIERAQSVALYEGLPDPTREPEIYWLEATRQKTVVLETYSFYARPLPLAPDEMEILRRLCADPATYSDDGAPAGGAFHPDYALVWRDGERFYRFLICFETGAARLGSLTGSATRTLRPDAAARLKDRLTLHHDVRPLATST